MAEAIRLSAHFRRHLRPINEAMVALPLCESFCVAFAKRFREDSSKQVIGDLNAKPMSSGSAEAAWVRTRHDGSGLAGKAEEARSCAPECG